MSNESKTNLNRLSNSEMIIFNTQALITLNVLNAFSVYKLGMGILILLSAWLEFSVISYFIYFLILILRLRTFSGKLMEKL